MYVYHSGKPVITLDILGFLLDLLPAIELNLTVKPNYKKLMLTKIWGQLDPKTCLNLTKLEEYPMQEIPLWLIYRKTTFSRPEVKLTPDFHLRVKRRPLLVI